MGEFKRNKKKINIGGGCISMVLNQVTVSTVGVNVLVWKQDNSPLSERCSSSSSRGRRTEGETPSRAPAAPPPRATSSRSQRGGSRQLRSSREGRTSAAGEARLRKKLSSLEEPKT